MSPTNPRAGSRQAPAARHSTPARDTYGTRDPGDLPHGCRCGARWSGQATCHCPTCHRTFTGVEAFDAHHPDRAGCGGPAELGMVVADGRAYEAWRLPDRSDAGRVRVWLAVLLATLVLVALVGLHQWSEAQGEDQAPVWSCHTMGNGRCGPDSPWHGVTVAP